MNRLKTDYSGGMPLVLDDIRYIEQAHRDALKGIVAGLLQSYPAVILHGCNLTDDGSNYQVSAGSIATQSEVFNVESHQVVKSPQGQHVWVVKETVEQSKTYKDSSSNAAYIKRTMELADSNDTPADAVEYAKTSVVDLMKALRGNLNINQATGWQKITLSPWLSHDEYNPLQVRRNIMGQIEVKGRFIQTDTATSSAIGLVESDIFKPDQNTRGSVYGYSSLSLCIFHTDGRLSVLAAVETDNYNEVNLITK